MNHETGTGIDRSSRMAWMRTRFDNWRAGPRHQTMARRARRAVLIVLWAIAISLIFVAVLIAVAVQALKPDAGEWKLTARIGPWTTELSIPGLIRLAAHPMTAPLIEGQVLRTRLGHWQWHRNGSQIVGVCAPCRVQLSAFGPEPLQLARARLEAAHQGAGRFEGALTMADGNHEVMFRFAAQLDHGGMNLTGSLTPTPIATLVRVFGRDLPEIERVQITGTLALTATARWPEGTWQAKPVVQDFSVTGLETERLMDVQLPMACSVSTRARTPATDVQSGSIDALGGWLPRALIAAEDARFFEHPGYEINALLAAGQHNRAPGTSLRGGSTLTQQLAKLVVTGDDRSAARKLRELLYAVEMERTLGKARILQLYLALVPWGQGVCGAERAAQIYLGRPAAQVGPVSSAWLVSLLRNPDAQLLRYARERRIDRDRMQQIIDGMRPMTAAQRAKAREQLQDWLP